MRRIFALILVIFSTSVRPQEVLESSGEMPDMSAVLPELVLSSGDGPVLIPEDDSNVTSGVAFLSNSTDDGRAETTATTGVTSTTRSPTTTTTVAATTTTTLAPTTTVTTTTERATTTTTSRPTTTTTTSTTEKPTTTTTRKPTTRTTTRRTTTAKTTVSTMSSTTEDFNVHAQQCFFVEEGFSCNVEVKCFGEGVIDCDAFEEEAQDATDEDESPSPSDDFSDDLEPEAEPTTVGLFPPELVGRVSPDRRPFLWHIDALPTVALDVDATNATTVAPSTTTETTRSATTERMAETSRATIVITISAETTTESRNVTTALPEILSINETELESQASADNQTFLATNDTDGTSENVTTSTTVAPEAEPVNTTIVVEDTTTVDTTVSTTEEPTTTTVTTTTTTTPAPTTTTIRTTTRRRTGRRYRRNDGAVSAPLQAAALESSRQKKAPVRSCRLTGNLRCSPVPSLAICTGRSACTVPPTTPGEKSEKSTSAKGVETWAIAVIAICAVAAAFTISLLIYLVVTSWKKLKVQPQNGVTTLTYVNSAQP